MADQPQLRPATADEIAETLSYAIRYDGMRRVHTADPTMAQITAERAGAPTGAIWVCRHEEAARADADQLVLRATGAQ